MFRTTSPQLSMLESQFRLPPGKRERLERSWAEDFRTKILPLIDEEPLRDAFCENNGRPNRSIRLLIGLHLLKEMFDLTDAETLDNMEFNLLWHHALCISVEEAHLPQKTLHNFRIKLQKSDRAQDIFDRLVLAMVQQDKLRITQQRLDSTHVRSNIASLTRLTLFVHTIVLFLSDVRKNAPERLEPIAQNFLAQYLDRDGYFSDVKRDEAKRRLPLVAQHLADLVRYFEADPVVSTWDSYALLVRLLHDQVDFVVAEPAAAAPSSTEPSNLTPDSDAASPVSPTGTPMSEPPPVTPTHHGAAAAKLHDQVDPATPEPPASASSSTESSSLTPDSDAAPPASPAGTPTSEPPPRTLTPHGTPAVKPKAAADISGSSLQSPHDPDATYGHKGKGYLAQIAETCHPDNPYELVTSFHLTGANASDQHALVRVLDDLAANGLKPERMFADTGYGSGENILAAAERGVDLHAPVRDPRAVRTLKDLQPMTLVSSDEETLPPGATVDPLVTIEAPATSSPDSASSPEQSPHVNAAPPSESEDLAPVAAPPDSRVDEEEGQKNKNGAIGCADDAAAAPKASSRKAQAAQATARRQSEQRTPAFREAYKIRSGIESTNAQLKGRHGAARIRVRGEDPMRGALIMKVLALNARRVVGHHQHVRREAARRARSS